MVQSLMAGLSVHDTPPPLPLVVFLVIAQSLIVGVVLS
jgi:hypothetical protein